MVILYSVGKSYMRNHAYLCLKCKIEVHYPVGVHDYVCTSSYFLPIDLHNMWSIKGNNPCNLLLERQNHHLSHHTNLMKFSGALASVVIIKGTSIYNRSWNLLQEKEKSINEQLTLDMCTYLFRSIKNEVSRYTWALYVQATDVKTSKW